MIISDMRFHVAKSGLKLTMEPWLSLNSPAPLAPSSWRLDSGILS